MTGLAGLAGRELGGCVGGGVAGEETRERGRGTGDATREIGSGTVRGDGGAGTSGWSSIGGGGALGSADMGCSVPGVVDGSGEGGAAKVISSIEVVEASALESALSGSV